jgi:integrase
MPIRYRKLPSGVERWEVDWYDSQGKRNRRLCRSKQEAKQFESVQSSIKFQEKTLGIKKAVSIKFEEFAEKFRNYSKTHSKPKTYKFHNDAIRTLNLSFADLNLENISLENVDQYKYDRLQKVKPSSVNRHLAVLKKMLNLAEEWGYLKNNISSKIKLLKEPPGRLRYLLKDEVPRLLQACLKTKAKYKDDDGKTYREVDVIKPKHLHLIVSIALNTGMRSGEILNLSREDIDLENGYIKINQSKTNKRREIPINAELKKLFLKYNMPESGKLFNIAEFKRSWNRAAEDAGLEDLKFHDLRHTFASHLVMQGVDLATVSNLLGHSTIQMTMRYAHLSPDHQKMAVEKISKAFKQSHSGLTS